MKTEKPLYDQRPNVDELWKPGKSEEEEEEAALIMLMDPFSLNGRHPRQLFLK